ncbi:MauE/DoxX family redox-associated membrane protein [Reyranella sp.]|uniref:MauE/DoxX family redox-associated membrane protein n=1 Tax=Reyranella sp. TaxID=1929291 RepID=UPI003D105C31
MKGDSMNRALRAYENATTGDVPLFLLRMFLGVLNVATGLGKGLDIPGFGEIIATYHLGLADQLLIPIAFVIAVGELVLGGWLLAGWRLAAAARGSIALNAGYCLLLASALWRGLALENCGCFGVFLASPLRWYSPLESLALAGAAYLLLRLARK